MNDNNDFVRSGVSAVPITDRALVNCVPFRRAIRDLDIALTGGRLATDNPEALEIGLILRGSREAQNLSQTRVAESAGLHQSTLSALERGQLSQGPNCQTLRTLFDVLGISLSYAASKPPPMLRDSVSVLSAPGSVDLLAQMNEVAACAQLTRLLVPEDELVGIQSAMAALLDTRRGRAHYFSPESGAYWQVRPAMTARLSTNRSILFLGLRDGGVIARPSTHARSAWGRCLVAPGQAHIEITNRGKTPFPFVTMPIYQAVAREFGVALPI